MPYLKLELALADPDAANDAQLARTLTRLTARHLAKDPSLTAVQIVRCHPARWFIGELPLPAHALASFHLQVQVTAGSNTKAQKAAYIAAVFEALQQQLGALHPASYVAIEEVPADAWGYGGRTQEQRFIAKAGAPADTPAPRLAA